MNAQTCAYALDGIAKHLKEGLGKCLGDLDSAVRMLRLPDGALISSDPDSMRSHLKSAKAEVDEISFALAELEWYAVRVVTEAAPKADDGDDGAEPSLPDQYSCPSPTCATLYPDDPEYPVF
jgi:hypothetical protein